MLALESVAEFTKCTTQPTSVANLNLISRLTRASQLAMQVRALSATPVSAFRIETSTYTSRHPKQQPPRRAPSGPNALNFAPWHIAASATFRTSLCTGLSQRATSMCQSREEGMGFGGVPQGSGKCFVMVEVDVVNTTVFVIRVRGLSVVGAANDAESWDAV